MIRRLMAVVIALLLALMPMAAMAQTTSRDVKARDITVSKLTDVLIVEEENSDYYKLMTPDGQNLTSASFSTIRSASSYPFFRVSAGTSVDGVHDEGIVDLQGNVIVPAVYADIEIISDRWQAGIRLTPSSADDKDYTFTNYTTDENSFYRIDTVDFFFDGQKVGTLDRSAYGGFYCTAHGAYVCVPDRTKKNVYYNSRMERSPLKVESSTEYVSEYKNGKTTYYHQGSGQIAFDPGCTLQPDEVDKAYNYDRGILYGLQGQQVFRPAQNYDYIRDFNDGYATVSMNRYYGLIDEQGNEVIPVEYDELGYNFTPKYGYIGAVKDGKFGYLDLKGNVTCDFTYSKDIVKDHGTFAEITNLDGTTIVLSAAVGELPEHYAETEFPGYEGGMVFIATNTAGEKGIVDLYGNVVVPFSADYNYISANKDGTVAVASMGSRNYRIFQIDIQPPVAEAAEPAAQEGAPATGNVNSLLDVLIHGQEGAPAAQEGWTCENGHTGNTGKFCPECGAPAPAKKTACDACGYEFPDGKVPKFCPECGAAQ